MTPPDPGAKRVAVLFTPVDESLAGVEGAMRLDMDLAVNAREVADALRSGGHDVRCLTFGSDPADLIAALRAFGTEAVFNLCECPLNSAQKEPHAAALLELLRMPYTGNGPFPLAACNDKALAKRILASMGIPTPEYRLYARVPAGPSGLRFPVIVKPAREDGSAGITEESVVEDEDALSARVGHVVGKYLQEALAEEFVGGREFNVAVLGNGTAADPHRVLPPAELVYKNPKWRVCSFESKWDTSHPSYSEIWPVCPADISPGLRRLLEEETLACARTFGLAGYARVDFRLDAAGSPVVLEVNPNPDIGSTAGLARAAKTAGVPHAGLVLEILRLGTALGAR